RLLMSAKSHREFLERSAREAALRARERDAARFRSPADVGRLTFQTVEPWKRIVMVLVGLVITAAGIAVADDSLIGGGVITLLGLLIILFGFRGRRRHLDAVFDSVDLVTLFDIIDW